MGEVGELGYKPLSSRHLGAPCGDVELNSPSPQSFDYVLGREGEGAVLERVKAGKEIGMKRDETKRVGDWSGNELGFACIARVL